MITGTTVVALHWGGGTSPVDNGSTFHKLDAGSTGTSETYFNSISAGVDMRKAISNGSV